jgi:integrase
MDLDLPLLCVELDRHGNQRYYVRKRVAGKLIRVRLHKPPGSPAFVEEYQAAAARVSEGKIAAEPGASRVGTLGWLANEWHNSHGFASTDPRMQRVRRLVMQATLAETTKPGSQHRFADCPISEFTLEHARMLRDRKRATPVAANRRLSELKKMLDWAIEERPAWVKRNPVRDVKPLKVKVIGFRAWTQDDVAKFEARWPIGTMPRLALAIMLFTGVRRSDAVRLGPPMVKDGSVTFIPQKTRESKKVLTLPILDVLQQIIDKTPTGIKSWLVTQWGKPFTSNGFGNWFRDRCDDAGLSECTAHGVRKIAAETAAENGATEMQMQQIFGWSSADLAAYYARRADQKKMAAAAMHTLIRKGS